MSVGPDVAGQTVAFLLGRRLLLGVVAALASAGWLAAASWAALPPGCAQSGRTVTCTYSSGSNPFTVPAGVTSIHVVAVGGRGGGNSGGSGAMVSGGLHVSAGSVLYAVVGANGGGRTPGGAGGGTGATDTDGISDTYGGDGGGASDVRSSANDLASRLLVAAGGGGGGGFGLAMVGTMPFLTRGSGGGGAGGGNTGVMGTSGGGGGGGGGSSSGGAGGAAGSTCISIFPPPEFPVICGSGAAGSAGVSGRGGDGGAGANFASSDPPVVFSGGGGGGGGGGLFGGGGGGGAFGAGNGGGGGSNLVPAGGSQAVDTTGTPQVEISYTIPRDPTSTSVRCYPSTLAPGAVTVCRATVTDTAGSGEPTPTGRVSFTQSGTGRLYGSPCTLLGSGASAGCAVLFTAFARGWRAIIAGYGGDGQHDASTGATLVSVALPMSTSGCLVSGFGRITAANGDQSTFRDLAVASPSRGVELFSDYGPARRFRLVSTSVRAVTCSPDASQASVFGSATIGAGGPVQFRIDIGLAAWEHGQDTYRIRLGTGYDSGAQEIRQADLSIRVHGAVHRHHDANVS